MANVIDQKIVEMRFDNKQFEAGVKETMGTIKKLKENLDFKDTDMSGLEKSVKNIEKLLSPVGGFIQRNIGKALDTAASSVKNLFAEFSQIKAITSGFQEYETQMDAVQTILANTQKEGTTIKDVNKALDELNTYADKTIYNFTQMTKNIGTFTAAGVDLKTSVSAIQGIANLAAVSGSNAQQASTAMYQLSQALASGTVKLQDWNSVVNAGMGGQLFQDALKETSRLLKTGVDEAIEAEGSFRESLKKGWLTTEVLTETLKKFTTSGAVEYLSNYLGLSKDVITAEYENAKATYGEADAIEKVAEALAEKTGKSKDDIVQSLKFAQTAEDAATKVKTFTQLIDTLKEALQSGWAMSFRILIGDFEEAKALFTDISDTLSALIGAQADARNRILQEVFGKNDSSKFLADMLKTDTETVNALKNLAKESGTSSIEFVNALSKFTEGDAVLTDLYTKLIDFANGDAHVVEYIGDMFNIDKDSVRVLRAWGEEFGFASDMYKDQLDRMKVGGPLVENTITALLKMEYLMNRMSGRDLLIDSFKNLYRVVTEVLKPIKEAWNEIFPKKAETATAIYNAIKGFNEFTKTLKISDEASKNIKATFRSLFSVLRTLGDVIKTVLSVAKLAIKPALEFLKIIPNIESKIVDLIDRYKAWKEEMVDADDAMYKLSFNMGYNMGIIMEKLIALKEAISKILKMESVQAVFKAIGEAFGFLGNKAKEGAIYVRDNLKAIWDAIKNFDFEKISTIAKNIAMLLMAFSGFRALKAVKGAFENLGDLLGSVGGALDAYARNMNATAIIKIAGAIAILAVALVILTMVDSKKLLSAAMALSLLAAVIFAGAAGLQLASNKGNDAAKALTIFSKGLSKAINTFAKAAYWAAVGAALIAFSIGLASVIASIVTIYNMYSQDADKLEKSIKIVGIISAIMVGTIALLSLLNSKFVGGTAGMETASNAMKSLAVLMGVTTFAIAKIFGMTLPTDWGVRLAILGGIFVALAGLALAVGLAGRIAAGGAAPGSLTSNPVVRQMFGGSVPTSSSSGAITAGPILALTGTLMVAVSSLQRLFDMTLPTDWKAKCGILAGMFVGLYGLAIAVGLAGKAAGNSKSLTTSILAMSLMLYVATSSVVKLMTMPFPDNYWKRLLMIEAMFASLAVLINVIGYASRMAGGALKAAGTLIALTVLIAAVTASLKILGEMDSNKLIKGSVALGIILLGVAAALYGAGKVTTADTAKSVWAMVGVIGSITASLITLAFVPWQKLLKSVVALEAVLITLKFTFDSLSKITANGALAASVYGLALVLAITTGSLMLLADKPWETVLISAISLSMVLLALTKSFKTLGGMYIDTKAIVAFVACAIALIPMAYALQMLSVMSWDQMIGGALGLAGLALALSKAFGIISKSGNISIKDIIAFAGMAAATIPMAYAMQLLSGMDISTLMAAALGVGVLANALALAFRTISNTQANLPAILSFVGMAVALIPMAYALSLLKGITIGDVIPALIGLAGAMTIIAIAGPILGAAAGPILIGAAAVVAFSVAIGAIGIALQVFGAGIDAVAPALKRLGKYLNKTFGGIGTAIQNALNNAGQGITNWLSNVGQWFANGWNGVMTFLGNLFSNIGNVFGGFFTWLGGLIGTIGQGIVTAFGGVGAGVVAVFQGAWNILTGIWNWFVDLFSNGIDLSGLQAQFNSLFGNININWSGIWNGLVTAAQTAWTWLTNLWTSVSTWFAGLNIDWGQVWESVVNFFKDVWQWLSDVWDFLQPILAKVVEWIKDAWAKMKEWFSDIKEKIEPIWNKLKEWGEKVISWVKDAKAKFKEFIDGVKEKIDTAKENVKKFFEQFKFQDLIDSVKKFGDTMKEVFGVFSKGVGDGIGGLWDFVSGAVKGVIGFITGLIDTIVAIVSPIVDLLKNVVGGAQTFIDDLTNPFKNAPALVQGAVDAFIGFFNNIATTIHGIFNQIGATIYNIAMLVQLTFTNIVNNINANAAAFFQAGQNLMNNLLNGFLGGIQQLIVNVQTGVQNIINTINGYFNQFLTAGTTMAVNLMTGIANGIKSAGSIVYAAILVFCKTVISIFTINLPMPNLVLIGTNVINWILQGVRNATPLLLSAIVSLCNTIIQTLQRILNRNVFYALGRDIDIWIADGIRSATSIPVSAATSLANAVISALRSTLNRSSTYSIGVDAANGIADGIRSRINAIAQAAIAAARAAIEAARAELQINSPSKVMIGVGGSFTEGFAMGITDDLSDVKSNARSMVLAAMNSANDEASNYTIDSSIFDMFNDMVDPSIKPLVDLSGVKSGVNQIQSLMDKKYNIKATVSGVNSASSSINSTTSKSANVSKDSRSDDQNSITNYTFTQNNYSPKALDRSEIYRQTNNQFSEFRRAVSLT